MKQITFRIRKFPSRAIRKRPFLLLEVLISIFLVMLILTPLLKTSLGIKIEEAKRIENLELQRVADGAFCDIKCTFFEKHQPEWKELEKGVEGALEPLERKFLSAKAPLTCMRSYKMTLIEKYKKEAGPHFLFLDIAISITRAKKAHIYHYPLLIEKAAHLGSS